MADFQCYRCGLWYDTKGEASECAKDDIFYDREAESFEFEENSDNVSVDGLINHLKKYRWSYEQDGEVRVSVDDGNPNGVLYLGKPSEDMEVIMVDNLDDSQRRAESFDADWDNAPYGSWDEAWSDQVTFTQRKGYFRPRNLALAGIAYWMAMKLRK